MAGLFNLLSKCDDALVAYIIAGGAGTATDVLPSKRSLPKTLPCTICAARRAKPLSTYSPTYEVEASIQVRSLGIDETASVNAADGPKQASSDRVASTFDLFHTNRSRSSGQALGDAITQAGGVSNLVIDDCCVTEVERGFEAKGDAWVDILYLKLVARPSAST